MMDIDLQEELEDLLFFPEGNPEREGLITYARRTLIGDVYHRKIGRIMDIVLGIPHMFATEKKKFNRVLGEFYDYLEGLGVEPILTQHTLLFIYRDGGFIGARNNVLCLGCDAKNLTREIIEKLKKEGICYLMKHGILQTNLLCKYEDVGIEVIPFHIIGDWVYMSLGGDTLHRWPKKLWGYGEIEFWGKKYRTHKDIEGWFEVYYGKDWRVRDNEFHWRNAPNILEGKKAREVVKNVA